jgi:hypothetical protein
MRTLRRRAICACLIAVASLLGACAADAPSAPGRASARTGLGGLFGGVFQRADAEHDPACELGDEVVGGQVEPGASDVVFATKKKAWEAALGGEEAARPYVRARLAGWPSTLTIDQRTLPAADREFVARLARDTWRGLDALTDRENHLPIDNVHLDEGSTVHREPRVGDYTNVTSVGLRLIAIVGAHELELVSRADAVRRLEEVLTTLDALESHDGFLFNYYDTTSLERTSNFISFVDSSWLTAGLMTVRNAFPELGPRCTRMIDRQSYRFFYDDVRELMSHGYYVHRRSRSLFHYGVLYAESRLGSLIAIGKGDVPEKHWFRMTRTFPAACRWQSMNPLGRHRKEVRGHTFVGGWYDWKGVRYVPSWGGSMFEALMPTLVFDETRHAPGSLGANDVAHVEVQHRYAAEELGYPVWGLSPSTTPGSDLYGEYGVKVAGSLGYAPGAVTPHAAALALGLATDAAANLRSLVERYPGIYGDYGFYDSVDPATGQVAQTYLTLDQTMIFLSAVNYLTEHAIQRHFAADPIAERAMPVVAGENFFD